MTLDSVIRRAQSVPMGAWVGVAALGLVWMTRPRPSSAVDGGVVMGSEDIQPVSASGSYNPIGAHAVGLPYDFHHLCPVSWEGRTKAYPTNSSGVIGMMAAPDPSDDDGYPWLTYGTLHGGI